MIEMMACVGAYAVMGWFVALVFATCVAVKNDYDRDAVELEVVATAMLWPVAIMMWVWGKRP